MNATTKWLAPLVCLVFSADASTAATLVSFDTSYGTILVDLFDEVTPLHVANFLNYATSNLYQNTVIHRSADNAGDNFVIQGGGYKLDQFPLLQHIPVFAPVPNEAQVSNLRGRLGAARLSDINSATSEWYFNMANNAFLDPQLFTVFGQVVGPGMSVADTIADLPTVNSPLPDVPIGTDGYVVLNNVSVLGTHPLFQNPLDPLDVNNDGHVSPGDLALVINHLTAFGPHPVNPDHFTGLYLDTNGDGQVNSLDVVVPEPSTIILAATGLIGLAAFGWRRPQR